MSDKTTTDETFIDRLMRLSKAKSIAELARWTGLHYNTLTNYKRDNRMPDSSVLVKLYEEKRVNAHWLLFGVGEPYSPGPTPADSTKSENQGGTTIETAIPSAILGVGDELLIQIPPIRVTIIRSHSSTDVTPNEVTEVTIPLIRSAPEKG
jgi:transcriptional regulator with XRE-family HTH domain